MDQPVETSFKFFRTPALRFYREVLAADIFKHGLPRSKYALANAEVLGFTLDASGKIVRAWFIHQLKPGDGQDIHMPTLYGDIAVNPLALYLNRESQPPDLQFTVSDQTVTDELLHHERMLSYWLKDQQQHPTDRESRSRFSAKAHQRRKPAYQRFAGF